MHGRKAGRHDAPGDRGRRGHAAGDARLRTAAADENSPEPRTARPWGLSGRGCGCRNGRAADPGAPATLQTGPGALAVSAVALSVSAASWANRATGRGLNTVLLVDDDPALRFVCRVNLELEGFLALEATSGDEALGLLEREPVALVFLDHRLEGHLDGLAVAREIRLEYPGVAVVGLTGVVPPPPEFAACVDEIVPKPFDVMALADVARRLCARGR